MKIIERLKYQEERLTRRINMGICDKKYISDVIFGDDNVLQEYCDTVYNVYSPVQHDMVERLEQLLESQGSDE